MIIIRNKCYFLHDLTSNKSQIEDIKTKNMKRTILTLLAAIIATSAGAQVVISLDNYQKYQTVEVKMTLQDDKTSEPISFASVYIIPQGDTTITNFSISDDKGNVVLEEVLTGKYEVNAEMIGYLPYKKVHEFKGWRNDLGIIKLKENPEFIDASTITAIGNPITVKKDTIEYNASSFHVGENAMLEDLLKKMPGMEVGEDGSVSVNGEQVDKITVGGKTFFFDDPSMAVKNLPAKIVDKIKVIDKKTEEAEITGMETHDSKEKVMDVALKEEYKKGWFGNAKFGGGYTLTPKTGNELTDHKGMLYNANGLMSAYGEKDQVVVIANGQNAVDPSASSSAIIFYGADYDEFDSKQGLSTNATAGVNYNSDRIRGLPTTVSVSYKYSGKDAKEKTARTSFITGSDDLHTDGFFSGTGDGHTVTTSIEMKNSKRDRFAFSFKPRVSFGTKQHSYTNTSQTTMDTDTLNSSVSSKFNDVRSVSLNGRLDMGVLKIGGKEGRNISLYSYFDLSNGDGRSGETSTTRAGEMTDLISLLYDSKSSSMSMSTSLRYVEPLNDKWSLHLHARTNLSASRSDKIATNGLDGTYNDYYTNITDNDYTDLSAGFTTLYKNGNHNLSFGLSAHGTETINYVKNLGTETTAGKGDWVMSLNPEMDYYYEKDTFSSSIYYYGSTPQPGSSQMSPTLNMGNATMISAGNIYLRPYMQNYLGTYIRHNNRENFSYVSANFNGRLEQNGIVQASWFDSDAIRYSVPVNSKTPSYTISGSVTYNKPFGKERHWTFSTYVNSSFSSSGSYQAKGQLEGMDIEKFDYAEFMSQFWGNAGGDRFYSGESGFAESKMTTLHYAADLGLKYQRDRFNTAVHAYGRNQISKYSLDPDANANTWMHSYSIEAMYTTRSNWEFSSKLNANFYVGYSAGFGAPQYNWNASISKSIKAVTLSLKGIDLLNQASRNLQRTATDEYIIDTYRNVLGRYFLFSISFNFGKMNAKKSQAVQDATWNMAF